MIKYLKITLLIVILAEEIKRAGIFKIIDTCDVCNQKFSKFSLLYDENYKICGTCAQIIGEINDSL